MKYHANFRRCGLVLVVALTLVTVPVSGPVSASDAPESGPTASTQHQPLSSLETDVVQQQEGAAETAACVEQANVSGGMPEARDEFLATFRQMNGTTAFNDYTEFEIIRSQVLLNVQAGSFEATDKQRSERVVRLLRRFTEAYTCQQEDQFVAALAAANDTGAVAEELAASGDGQLGVLGDLALTRFYTELGEELRSRGEGIERTPDRIEAFEIAAVSFRRAGATDQFAQLSVRLDETRQVYRSDMEAYNESIAVSQSFVDGCSSCESSSAAIITFGPGIFDRYVAARQASTETAEAAALARKHSLEDRGARADALGSEVTTARNTLAVAAVSGMLGVALVIGLIAGLIGSRLAAWRRDLEDSQLGNVVLIGEMLDA